MTKHDPVTIRDVARAAGVSPGTVSRAINNSPLVKEATRQRILQVVRELDYRPNLMARRLSTGKTLTIKVLAPFFTRPSVSQRLSGVVAALADSEYDLVIHNIATPEQRAACFDNLPGPDEVDGALVISLTPDDREVAQLQHAAVPIVFIDVHHRNLAKFSQVYVDDIAGGQKAVRHLLSLGHARIGFVGDAHDNAFHFVSSRNRYRGYCRALSDAGVLIDAAYCTAGEHGRIPAQGQAQELLTRPKRPTAIFAASDTQAVGVLQAAEAMGLRVPGDLSLVGYDDLEIAEIMGLTTVRQPLTESGRRGAELLLAHLHASEVDPVAIELPTRLIARATTAPVEEVSPP